jgi:hypothetical protein
LIQMAAILLEKYRYSLIYVNMGEISANADASANISVRCMGITSSSKPDAKISAGPRRNAAFVHIECRV